MKHLNSSKTYILSIFLVSFYLFTNAQVGIGNTDPKTQLDVDGALSLREGTALTLSNGLNSDVSLGATPYSTYRITGPTSDFSIRSITAETDADGQIVTLVNTTTQDLTIVHNSGAGAARIYCPSENDILITGRYSTLTLQYNTTLNKWILISFQDGSASSDDWSTSGNTGTTAGTNFLGTTDGQALSIFTDNSERLRISALGHLRSFTDGTAALPVYTWDGDRNTGLFRSGDDILNFASGGLEFIELFEGTNDELRINDTAQNINFRVESELESNMLYLDAEENQVFIKSNIQHLGYIDALNVYANKTGSSTIGIQYAMAGWNQGNQGGGGNFVIEDTTNPFAAMEASTEGTGIANRGLITSTTSGAWATTGTSNDSDSIGVYGSVPTTGTWLGYGGIFTGGLGYANGLYNLSDERTKRDIKEINSTFALDKILNIKGYTYKYDLKKFNSKSAEDSKTYYGFMAQNVKEFLPHSVAIKKVPFRNEFIEARSTREDSGKDEILNVVDYTSIIPILVEAMKEQQAQIETLKAKISELEKK